MPPSARASTGKQEVATHKVAAKPPEKLGHLLRCSTVADLADPKQIPVWLPHNITVAQGLQELARHNILSAPLVAQEDFLDEYRAFSESGDAYVPALEYSLVGWVDVHDIVVSLLDFLTRECEAAPTKMLPLATMLEREGPKFAEKMLITVMGGHDHELVLKSNSKIPLLKAIRELFLQPKERDLCAVHRLAIFDSTGAVRNIISQSDVLRFLLSHMDALGELANSSLRSLGLAGPGAPVFSIDVHVPTLLAFKQMADAHVSGAAIIDVDGQLVANLSISDLRQVQVEQFGMLALPVAEYLSVLHHTSYAGYSVHLTEQVQANLLAAASGGHPTTPHAWGHVGLKGRRDRLVTLHADNTLKELLHALVDNRVHRVYVTTQRHGMQHADAVITPTDVLRLVAAAVE